MNFFKAIGKLVIGTGKKISFLYFLYEIFVFALIASLAGFIISFPIFYLGTNYKDVYKTLGALIIVLCLFALFCYRILKSFREQKRTLSSSLEDIILSSILAFPSIFPLWIRSISIFILSSLLIASLIILLAKLSLYLLTSYGHFYYLDNASFWLSSLIEVIVLIIRDFYRAFLLLFFGLSFIVILFSGKSIVEKYKKSYIKWALFALELAIILFIAYFFIYIIISILF